MITGRSLVSVALCPVAGWSEKTTSSGATYYENHVTKSTTWERPAAPVAAPVFVPQAAATSGGSVGGREFASGRFISFFSSETFCCTPTRGLMHVVALFAVSKLFLPIHRMGVSNPRGLLSIAQCACILWGDFPYGSGVFDRCTYTSSLRKLCTPLTSRSYSAHFKPITSGSPHSVQLVPFRPCLVEVVSTHLEFPSYSRILECPASSGLSGCEIFSPRVLSTGVFLVSRRVIYVFPSRLLPPPPPPPARLHTREEQEGTAASLSGLIWPMHGQ